MTEVVAALALALLVLVVPVSGHGLARLHQVEPGLGRRRHPLAVAVPAGTAAAVGLGYLAAGGAGAALGLCGSLVGFTVGGLWARALRQRRAQRRREEIVDACQLLAGLLRVGHVPVVALRIAAADCEVFAEAAAAQRVGGSASATLRKQGARPGASALVELAVAWEVAERTGASMTSTLDALTDRLAAARQVSRVVDAELSAPRASGRLLAALPLFGLVIGYSMGGDPGAFLLASPLGQLCLCAGVALDCAGVWWLERISGVGS